MSLYDFVRPVDFYQLLATLLIVAPFLRQNGMVRAFSFLLVGFLPMLLLSVSLAEMGVSGFVTISNWWLVIVYVLTAFQPELSKLLRAYK
jgi:hypothetical protein